MKLFPLVLNLSVNSSADNLRVSVSCGRRMILYKIDNCVIFSHNLNFVKINQMLFPIPAYLFDGLIFFYMNS